MADRDRPQSRTQQGGPRRTRDASPARQMAYRLLGRVADGQYANLSLDAALKRSDLGVEDRRLCTALVYGVLERRVTLDFIIEQLAGSKSGGVDDPTRRCLYLGLYQLCFMDRVPAYAAVYESVALAPRRSAGFVNALLRGAQRQGLCALRSPSQWAEVFPTLKESPLEAASVAYGVPRLLCRLMHDVFGASAQQEMEALLTPPPLTLRLNPLRQSAQALTAVLTAEGYRVSPGKYSADALLLDGGTVSELPGFAEGWFFVQDEASQLCVQVVDPQPNAWVADVCACPGSKSYGMGLRMNNQGKILASDVHERKLSLIRSGAERLGLSLIEACCRDATQPCPSLEGRCDRVLCDVPCSGLGVMAKKPEIRHKDPAQWAGLPRIQRSILEHSARYVRPGGVLVYSTCTWRPEENQGVTDLFCADHPEFEPDDFFIPALHGAAPDLRSERGHVTLTPAVHGTDGFYIARFRRR